MKNLLADIKKGKKLKGVKTVVKGQDLSGAGSSPAAASSSSSSSSSASTAATPSAQNTPRQTGNAIMDAIVSKGGQSGLRRTQPSSAATAASSSNGNEHFEGIANGKVRLRSTPHKNEVGKSANSDGADFLRQYISKRGISTGALLDTSDDNNDWDDNPKSPDASSVVKSEKETLKADAAMSSASPSVKASHPVSTPKVDQKQQDEEKIQKAMQELFKLEEKLKMLEVRENQIATSNEKAKEFNKNLGDAKTRYNAVKSSLLQAKGPLEDGCKFVSDSTLKGEIKKLISTIDAEISNVEEEIKKVKSIRTLEANQKFDKDENDRQITIEKKKIADKEKELLGVNKAKIAAAREENAAKEEARKLKFASPKANEDEAVKALNKAKTFANTSERLVRDAAVLIEIVEAFKSRPIDEAEAAVVPISDVNDASELKKLQERVRELETQLKAKKESDDDDNDIDDKVDNRELAKLKTDLEKARAEKLEAEQAVAVARQASAKEVRRLQDQVVALEQELVGPRAGGNDALSSSIRTDLAKLRAELKAEQEKNTRLERELTLKSTTPAQASAASASVYASTSVLSIKPAAQVVSKAAIEVDATKPMVIAVKKDLKSSSYLSEGMLVAATASLFYTKHLLSSSISGSMTGKMYLGMCILETLSVLGMQMYEGKKAYNSLFNINQGVDFTMLSSSSVSIAISALGLANAMVNVKPEIILGLSVCVAMIGAIGAYKANKANGIAR